MADGARRLASPWTARACLLLSGIGGLVVGILTSLGQGLLPNEVASLANSAGAWCLAAFLLALPNRTTRLGLLLGPIALLAMLAGYDLATLVRGGAVSTSTVVFWGAAAVVVGPVLGVGAVWARDRDPRRVAIGVAPLAGILIGEAVHGLTAIADTTYGPYWVGEAVVGLLLVAWVGARTRSAIAVLACAALAAAGAALIVAALSGDLLSLL